MYHTVLKQKCVYIIKMPELVSVISEVIVQQLFSEYICRPREFQNEPALVFVFLVSIFGILNHANHFHF